MTQALTEQEMRCWNLWKRATDRVWERVGQQITAQTGLSVADFSVLTRTVEAPSAPRQQDLADSLAWSRSRLSRQLTRMEDRGLITRSATPATTTVQATATGRRLVATARLAHADAVRVALLDDHPPADETFWSAVESVGNPR